MTFILCGLAMPAVLLNGCLKKYISDKLRGYLRDDLIPQYGLAKGKDIDELFTGQENFSVNVFGSAYDCAEPERA